MMDYATPELLLSDLRLDHVKIPILSPIFSSLGGTPRLTSAPRRTIALTTDCIYRGHSARPTLKRARDNQSPLTRDTKVSSRKQTRPSSDPSSIGAPIFFTRRPNSREAIATSLTLASVCRLGAACNRFLPGNRAVLEKRMCMI